MNELAILNITLLTVFTALFLAETIRTGRKAR